MSDIKEAIFSHAVELYQAGQMKSTIYASEHTVFILNMDNTVLLRFAVPSGEPRIEGEVSFIANDYDSDDFREVDGRIVFTQREGKYIRQKSCRAPEKNFIDIENLWNLYVEDDRKDHHNEKVIFTKPMLKLLDLSLSHLEIFSEDKRPVVLQRDIYTGSIIRIDRNSDSGFGISVTININEDFGPIGIRTNDFIALFSFNDTVSFYFSPTSPFMLVEGDKLSMSGVLAGCVYDEMDTTTVIKEGKDGRKKPKNRRRKQKAGPTPDETEKKRPEFKRKRRAA